MKKTLRERSKEARESMNESKAFTYNNLAKMDSESRFNAILKYIKTLDSKNKSHQIILGEIASALRGHSPKYAFKEVEIIADLSAKGFISRDMENKLASHLPMNEVDESKSVKDGTVFNEARNNMASFSSEELEVLLDAIQSERRRLSDTSYKSDLVDNQEEKLEIANDLYFQILSAMAKNRK